MGGEDEDGARPEELKHNVSSIGGFQNWVDGIMAKSLGSTCFGGHCQWDFAKNLRTIRTEDAQSRLPASRFKPFNILFVYTDYSF